MDHTLQKIIALLNYHFVDIKNIDPNKLFHMGEIHRMNGQLYLILKKHYPNEFALLNFYKQKRKIAQLYAIQQASISVALNRLANMAGKPLIFLKGISLSQQLYGDIAVRTAKDIDVLVKKNDVIWFDKQLRAQGYQTQFELNHMTRNYEKMIFSYCKAIDYFHPKKKIALELHWKLSEGDQFSKLNYDEILDAKNQKTVLINQHLLPIFPDPLNFLYLCFHAENHFCERLYWMFDTLCYAVKMNIWEWESIFKLAEIHHIKSQLYYLIERWKFFFPQQTKNIPLPHIKKMRSYPRQDQIFQNHTTFIGKNKARCTTILAKISINHSWRNACRTVFATLVRNHIGFYIKHHLPIFLFYVGLPLLMIVNVVTPLIRTSLRYLQESEVTP